jgi:hypothetical protein
LELEFPCLGESYRRKRSNLIRVGRAYKPIFASDGFRAAAVRALAGLLSKPHSRFPGVRSRLIQTFADWADDSRSTVLLARLAESN